RAALFEGGVDGESLRVRDGRTRVLRRHPGSWWLWLRLGFSGRADLSRRARVPDLRRHERNPAAGDRPRHRGVTRHRERTEWRAPLIFFLTSRPPTAISPRRRSKRWLQNMVVPSTGTRSCWASYSSRREPCRSPTSRSRATTRGGTSQGARAFTACRNSGCRRGSPFHRRPPRGSCCGRRSAIRRPHHLSPGRTTAPFLSTISTFP